MKLSVITGTERQNECVLKITEYTNTQNKINQSVF